MRLILTRAPARKMKREGVLEISCSMLVHSHLHRGREARRFGVRWVEWEGQWDVQLSLPFALSPLQLEPCQALTSRWMPAPRLPSSFWTGGVPDWPAHRTPEGSESSQAAFGRGAMSNGVAERDSSRGYPVVLWGEEEEEDSFLLHLPLNMTDI